MAGGVAHDTHRRLSSRNAASSSSFIVAKGCGMACDKFCRFHKVRALFPTHTNKQGVSFTHTAQKVRGRLSARAVRPRTGSPRLSTYTRTWLQPYTPSSS